MYDKYHSHGLEILAFPCNQFGGEEAGTAAEIRSFAREKLNARFRIMSKVDVSPFTVVLMMGVPARAGPVATCSNA